MLFAVYSFSGREEITSFHGFTRDRAVDERCSTGLKLTQQTNCSTATSECTYLLTERSVIILASFTISHLCHHHLNQLIIKLASFIIILAISVIILAISVIIFAIIIIAISVIILASFIIIL